MEFGVEVTLKENVVAGFPQGHCLEGQVFIEVGYNFLGFRFLRSIYSYLVFEAIGYK